MKLSCLPVSFFDDITSGRMTVGQWAAMGKGLGLDAVDLSILFVPDRSPKALATMRRQVQDAGTHITMITSYPDFTHPDPGQRARYVRVTAGQAHPEMGREKGVRMAIEGLTELAELTAGSGVTLVYENHAKPGAWTYTDFSQPPELFLEIAREVAPAGIRVNFDLGNAAAFADDPVRLLGKVIGQVETVHASDTRMRGALDHVLLGTGVTPYRKLFARLKQAGWDNWICMEENSRTGREGVAAAAAFVRSTWEAA